MLSEAAEAKRTAFYYVVTAAGVSALTATTLGYDVGIMADAALYIQDDFNLSDERSELIIGSLNLISAFGALLGGPCADKFGRKPAVSLCVILYLVGTALMAGAPNWVVLLLGRIVTGLGVGVAFVVCPVYVAELAPAEMRGRLTTLFDISINGGILVGYVVGFLCDVAIEEETPKWRTMLALGAVPPLIVLVCLGLLPESPRYLIMRGKSRKAREVLRLTLGSDGLAQQEFEAIRHALGFEDSPRPDEDAEGARPADPDADDEGQEAASWGEVLFPRTRLLQRALFIVLGLAFWQQATGSEAILYYSATFLQEAGLTSRGELLLGNIGLGICKLLPEALSLVYVDKLGRVQPLVFSAASSTLFIFLLGMAYSFVWDGVAVVGLLCGFMLSFSVAIGPFTWVVAAEVLPLPYRAKGTMLGIFLNRFTSGTVALSALSTADALGYPMFFFLYASVSLLSVVFYSQCVPETAGKSLEETEAMLAEMQPLEYCPCEREGESFMTRIKSSKILRVPSVSGNASQYKYHAVNDDATED